MNKLHFVLISLLAILSSQFLAVAYQVFAQQPTQNLPFCTKVGDAPGPNPCLAQPGITPGGPLSGAVEIASRIVGLLSKGPDGYFNAKADEPGVYYWCTYLIVDAYNQAGFAGLSRSSHAAVLAMKSFFTNTQGYRLLTPDSPVESLAPGNVVFFEGSGNQHASLIKSIELGPNGDGAIITYDSNNVSVEDRVFVVNHKATKAQTTARLYQITGFGQVI